MRLTETKLNISDFPEEILWFLKNAHIYDSSCSPEARVYFIDKDDGYFLKTSNKGLLSKERELTEYFHKKELAPEVLFYKSEDVDFLLTKKAKGLDATSKTYLENPKKLAEKMGEILRELHCMNFEDCPEKDRMRSYFNVLDENYKSNHFDLGFGNFKTKDEAYAVAQRGRDFLKSDTLIHGDFCLPNIIFDSWNFSSFIDLGGAGVGDRHVDIFWGAWTLKFNLKTDAYKDLFFSSYGKENIEKEALEIVSAIEIFA